MMNIWEKKDGESALWFGRFQAFLLMGRERSLLRLYNEERRKKAETSGKPFILAKSTPGAWDKAAIEYGWRNRAEAFDFAELKKEFGDVELMVLLQRKRRLEMYDATLDRINQKIQHVNLDEVTLPQLVAALRILSEQQRADLNDTPAQRPPAASQPRRIARVRTVVTDVSVSEYDAPP